MNNPYHIANTQAKIVGKIQRLVNLKKVGVVIYAKLRSNKMNIQHARIRRCISVFFEQLVIPGITIAAIFDRIHKYTGCKNEVKNLILLTHAYKF